MGLKAFLAHENIEVSDTWQDVLLNELNSADIFIALLSKGYFESLWCSQEAGIAASRKLPIIPLSLDGTIPLGFISPCQSIRVTNDKYSLSRALVKGLAKANKPSLIDGLIHALGLRVSYDWSGWLFKLLQANLTDATNEQIVRLLEAADKNDQFYPAKDCADGLRSLFKSHSHLLSGNIASSLRGKLLL